MKLIRKVLAISSIVLAAAAFTACNSSPNYNTTIATASRGVETSGTTDTLTFTYNGIKGQNQWDKLEISAGDVSFLFNIELDPAGTHTISYRDSTSYPKQTFNFSDNFTVNINLGAVSQVTDPSNPDRKYSTADFSVIIGNDNIKTKHQYAINPDSINVRVNRTEGNNSLDSIEISGGGDQWTINN